MHPGFSQPMAEYLIVLEGLGTYMAGQLQEHSRFPD
jgi:hypothetical protein